MKDGDIKERIILTEKRRWHFWCCIEGIGIKDRGEAEILAVKAKGFKAKQWCPLISHLWSGHFHVVVLCTTTELLKLAGVERGRAAKDVTIEILDGIAAQIVQGYEVVSIKLSPFKKKLLDLEAKDTSRGIIKEVDEMLGMRVLTVPGLPVGLAFVIRKKHPALEKVKKG